MLATSFSHFSNVVPPPSFVAKFIAIISPANSPKNAPTTPRVTPKVFQGIDASSFAEIPKENIANDIASITFMESSIKPLLPRFAATPSNIINPANSAKNAPITPSTTPIVSQGIVASIFAVIPKEKSNSDMASI